MTPGEVASLQALAQQHGGSLSINPQTGLPEAGFLSALLPMAAGAGLAAMGMPAGYAALSIGAASAATNGGNMREAMKNGFLAYSGAGVAGSFMEAGAGAMGTSAATPATVLETPAGATSPYALTGSSAAAAPSTAGYSLGESSSYLNQPLPSLVSAAPAEVAQAAAATTPAAQAAQQAASLDTMNMSQRFDALKAGASGTNAMNYIKANPFTSLGVASIAMTPDENKTPQKAADTDRGPRAGMRYYPGYGTSLPKPNMQGVEQTFNRPYYAAKGGVTRMATGGITSAPRNQQQLFADYLQRVSSSGVAATPPTNKYDWWKSGGAGTPAAAPTETPEEYAARVRLNARGGGGGGKGEKPEPSAWDSMTDTEKTEYYAQHPFESKMADLAGTWLTKGLGFGVLGMGMDAANGPGYVDRKLNILRGTHPPANSPLAGGPLGTGYDPKTGVQTYGPPMSEIDRVTASDAANAAYQRAQAEAENDARIQGDLNPYTSSQFSASPPAGYTSSQFSATPSTGYTSSQFSDKSLAPTTRGDPFAGFFNSDPTLNQIAKRDDPSKQDPKFFPPGTAYTDTTFFRDSYGNLISIGEPIGGWANPMRHPDGSPMFASSALPGGSTASGNVAIAAQNAIAGSDMQRALDSQATTYSVTGEKLVPQFNDAGKIVGYKALPSAEAQATPVPSSSLTPSDVGAPSTEPAGGPIGIGYPDYKVAPDITPSVPNAISADPDADKTTESLGIPDAATFAAMLGAPLGQYAALNNGVVSDAGVSGDPALAGYQGMYNPGYVTPNMGRASSGVAAGFGGLGSAWRTALGLPVVDGQGNPILTSQGAAQQAYNESPQGVQDANDAETQSLQNRYGGGSGFSGSGAEGGSSPTADRGANNSENPGWGSRDAGADGGLSTPYGFQHMANGGLSAMANPYDLGSYSDGGRLLRGPGDGVSDSIPATIGKGRPARLADGEFVIPARIVSEIGNGSTDAGARKLYAMMDRIQAGRKKSVGKGKVAVNSRAYKHLPA